MSFANTSLFVGDLPKFCTENDLENLFAQFGPLLDVKIKRNVNTGKTLSYGFVTFANEATANEALRRLDQTMFFGRKLRLRWAMYNARSQHSSSPGSVINSVYVRFTTAKCDRYVTEEDLHRVFQSFGKVVDVSVKESAIDPRLNRQSGYGFVHFSCDAEGVEAAFMTVSSIDNATIDGITYNVELSKNLLKQFNERQQQLGENTSLRTNSFDSTGSFHSAGGVDSHVPLCISGSSSVIGEVFPGIASANDGFARSSSPSVGPSSLTRPSNIPPSNNVNGAFPRGSIPNSPSQGSLGVAMQDFLRNNSNPAGSFSQHSSRSPSPLSVHSQGERDRRLPPDYTHSPGGHAFSNTGYVSPSAMGELPFSQLSRNGPGNIPIPSPRLNVPMGASRPGSREGSVYNSNSPQHFRPPPPPMSPGYPHMGTPPSLMNVNGGLMSGGGIAMSAPLSRPNSSSALNGMNAAALQGKLMGRSTPTGVRSSSPMDTVPNFRSSEFGGGLGSMYSSGGLSPGTANVRSAVGYGSPHASSFMDNNLVGGNGLNDAWQPTVGMSAWELNANNLQLHNTLYDTNVPKNGEFSLINSNDNQYSQGEQMPPVNNSSSSSDPAVSPMIDFNDKFLSSSSSMLENMQLHLGFVRPTFVPNVSNTIVESGDIFTSPVVAADSTQNDGFGSQSEQDRQLDALIGGPLRTFAI